MGNEKLTVAVVMPCRNEAACIEETIRCILRQDSEGVELEILIADGASTDGTREIVERLAAIDGRVRLIDNPAGYVSTGLNLAINAARSEIIIRMDAHTDYAPDYVRQCLLALQETGAENVGGPARTKATKPMQKAIAAAYHSPFACGGARFHDVEHEGYVDTVTYGCWRKETLQRLGMFDEALIRNQDDELNYRTIRSGGKIWQTPKIVSWYHPRSSLRTLFRQYFQYGFWKVAVIRKHGTPASLRHLLPGAFVLSLLVLALASSMALWETTRVAGLTAGALLVIALGSYLAVALASAGMLLRICGVRTAALLPVVFATYHVSYGTGFLHGLWHFRKRREQRTEAGEAFTSLTR
jgi:glycosyltransferase involved in cell wall biosynthesis